MGKTSWDNKIDKTIILNIDWVQVADVEQQEQIKAVAKAEKKAEQEQKRALAKAEKKAKTDIDKQKVKAASSSKLVKKQEGINSGDETVRMTPGTFSSLKDPLVDLLLDGTKLKQNLGVLVLHVMNLKKSLSQAPSEDASAKELVENIEASLLTVAADSDLGNHNSLNDLSEAVTADNAKSDVTSIITYRKLLLEKLYVVIPKSEDKVKIVDVTVELLKDAFGWVHNPEYDLQKGSMKNNFVLVETTMLNSIWNAYHDEANKAP